MLNTKYIIQNKSVIKQILSLDSLLWSNAWFVQNIDTVDSNEDELKSIKSFFFDPSITAIINKDQLNLLEEFEYDSTATINLLASKDNYNLVQLVYKTSDLKSNQLAVFLKFIIQRLVFILMVRKLIILG